MRPAFLAPFSNRNYRLYFSGQLISLIGTFMTFTALSWVVYVLTNSPLMLGALALASQAPTLIASPFAGVWVDRLDRRRLLIATQLLSLLESLALTVLAFTHTLNIWFVLVLSVFQGLVNAFDLPTRQAMVSQIAEKREDLPGVIGMNSTMFNLGRMLGPPLGGMILSSLGAGACFLIDTISYVGVLCAVFAMRVRPQQFEAKPRPVLEDLKTGMLYSIRTRPIRTLMLTLGWVSLFGMSYAVMNPAFARDVFRGDAHLLGWLMAASALGSISGALRTASRTGIRQLARGMLMGVSLLAAGMLVYAMSNNVALAMVSLFVAGMGSVTFITSSNALIQNLVEEDKRGRVMSWYGLCFQGGFPLGGLMIGALATRFGVSHSVFLWGLLTGFAALYIWATQSLFVSRAEQLWLKQSEIVSMHISETSTRQR
ncbi:MAG: MFS transporter [Chthoniobacterales bacterium]